MALPAGRRGIRASLVKSDGTIIDLNTVKEDLTELESDLTELESDLTELINSLNVKELSVTGVREGSSISAYQSGNIVFVYVSSAASIPQAEWTEIGTISNLNVRNATAVIGNANYTGFGAIRVNNGIVSAFHNLSGSQSFFGASIITFTR